MYCSSWAALLFHHPSLTLLFIPFILSFSRLLTATFSPHPALLPPVPSLWPSSSVFCPRLHLLPLFLTLVFLECRPSIFVSLPPLQNSLSRLPSLFALVSALPYTYCIPTTCCTHSHKLIHRHNSASNVRETIYYILYVDFHDDGASFRWWDYPWKHRIDFWTIINMMRSHSNSCRKALPLQRRANQCGTATTENLTDSSLNEKTNTVPTDLSYCMYFLLYIYREEL